LTSINWARGLLVIVTVMPVSLAMSPAHAAFEVTRIPVDHLPDGTPGLGGGIRVTRDVYLGRERDPDLVPLYLYEGKWLFANGTSAGIHLLDNDKFFFNLIGRYRFNKLIPEDYEDIPDDLSTRRQTIDGGDHRFLYHRQHSNESRRTPIEVHRRTTAFGKVVDVVAGGKHAITSEK